MQGSGNRQEMRRVWGRHQQSLHPQTDGHGSQELKVLGVNQLLAQAQPCLQDKPGKRRVGHDQVGVLQDLYCTSYMLMYMYAHLLMHTRRKGGSDSCSFSLHFSVVTILGRDAMQQELSCSFQTQMDLPTAAAMQLLASYAYMSRQVQNEKSLHGHSCHHNDKNDVHTYTTMLDKEDVCGIRQDKGMDQSHTNPRPP